jgi:hypothetical protein
LPATSAIRSVVANFARFICVNPNASTAFLATVERPRPSPAGQDGVGIWTDEALARLAGLLPTLSAPDGAARRKRLERRLKEAPDERQPPDP